MPSDVQIFEVEQGGEDWAALRLGIPTASCFAQVWAGGDGKVRSKYMRQLAGERLTGQQAEKFRGPAMDRGNAVEPSLRASFAIDTGLSLRQVGFVQRTMPWGRIGASPDSLIGEDSGVEFKSAAPDILIEILQADRVPPEHMPQVQGSMLVSGRPEWWLAIGYPGLPMFRRRIKRDSAYIARLELALKVFCEELEEMVAWLKNYR